MCAAPKPTGVLKINRINVTSPFQQTNNCPSSLGPGANCTISVKFHPCILSHVGPGIQAIPNTSEAIATSRRWNDYLAEHTAKYPKRLKGFAALPMQDPQAAAQELTRCVKELGFCGALVAGFSPQAAEI